MSFTEQLGVFLILGILGAIYEPTLGEALIVATIVVALMEWLEYSRGRGAWQRWQEFKREWKRRNDE